MKKAIFSYTLHKKEAMRNEYPRMIVNIEDCKIKIPKDQQKWSPDSSSVKLTR